MRAAANYQNRRCRSENKRLLVAAAFMLTLTLLTSCSLSAQSYFVLYNFAGQGDGANPAAGLTLDWGGNLYGTTRAGGVEASGNCNYQGATGCGTVFKLSHHGAGWLFSTLYKFTGTPDGANSLARVVFSPNGTLYGTTNRGGPLNAGTVFELQPPSHNCPTTSCPWLEAPIYNSFDGQYGGGYPGGGDLIFDAQGNIYGTTAGGGGYLCDDGSCGTVWRLSPGQGGWAIAYFSTPFGGLTCCPYSGLLQTSTNTFYGTTQGTSGGLYQIVGQHGSVTYTFSDDSAPLGGLIEDAAGNLYGTTSQGGANNVGSVFEEVPNTSSLTTLYSFSGTALYQYAGPTATLLMDAAGNLYGTTQIDGAHQQGSVFKLSQSNGVWTFTTLHDFTGGADGGQPFGQLTMDAAGNIYGTAEAGGSSVGNCYQGLGCGVIFEITLN